VSFSLPASFVILKVVLCMWLRTTRSESLEKFFKEYFT
jgi:hypothetical protein